MNKIVFSAGCPLTLALSPEGGEGKEGRDAARPYRDF